MEQNVLLSEWSSQWDCTFFKENTFIFLQGNREPLLYELPLRTLVFVSKVMATTVINGDPFLLRGIKEDSQHDQSNGQWKGKLSLCTAMFSFVGSMQDLGGPLLCTGFKGITWVFPNYSFLFYLARGIVFLNCQSTRHISGMPSGKIGIFGTNIPLDSVWRDFDFGGEKVKGQSHWPHKTFWRGHNSRIKLINTT